MSIETLKEQARRHEQKEEWQKALAQYKKAIARLAEEDQPDIGLYNRVGDLYVRVGELVPAVEHYEQSVDLYLEAFLPNNAIAVCKKIIRNVPDRHIAYLKMGQIRAEQGFLPDARTNFLTYAERMQQVGDLDESFRALVEFCDLAPDDVDIRIIVADQMVSNGRKDEAIEQLTGAYRHLIAIGATGQASAVGAKIHELDPAVDLGEADTPAAARYDSAPLVDADDLGGQFSHQATGLADAAEEDQASGIDLGGFEIDTGGDPEDEEAAEPPSFDIGGHDEEEAGELPVFDMGGDAGDGEGLELPSFDIVGDEAEDGGELPTFDMGDDGEDVEAVELPTFDMGDDADDADDAEAVELPTFDMGDDADDAEAVELPTFDMGDHADDVEGGELPMLVVPADSEAAELPIFDAGVDSSVADAAEQEVLVTSPGEAVQEAMEDAAADAVTGEVLTIDDIREQIASNQSDVALRQRMVELAYGTGEDSVLAEAFLGLAQTLDEAGEKARAHVAYQQVLDADPGNEVAARALGGSRGAQPVREVAASEDYVDLGAMILGDDDEEKSTRFTVAYEEPSGDEQADFAKMLTQFKHKVSESLGADDVRAHHDLGTAYKEMGLLDEAISEFQAALRASTDHLPTYELLGATFLEIGQPEAAANSLERALSVAYEIEDELLGIYYYLGQAHEALGHKERAVELYDKVFSLDINFADVTERLRALR